MKLYETIKNMVSNGKHGPLTRSFQTFPGCTKHADD